MSRYTPQPWGGARPDVVPRALAQEIAAERDALATHYERARRELDALRRTLAAREEERANLVQTIRALDHGRRGEAAPPVEDPRLLGRVRRLEEELDRARADRAEAVAEREAAGARADAVQAALERAHAEVAELRDARPDQARVQRLAADLANLRRRQEESIAAGVRAERIRWVGRLADVRDSVSRAILASADGASPWHAGLTGILAQIDGALRAEGVRLIGTPGDPFDPSVHEAMGVTPSPGFAPGVVVTVARTGLELDDGTLARPAQVFVTPS